MLISMKDYPDSYDMVLEQDFEDVRALEFLAIYLGLDNVCSKDNKNYPGVQEEIFRNEMMTYEYGSFDPPLPCFRGN